MLFVTLSPTEAAGYAYMCNRLKEAVNKMCTARKTIEAAANASFDKHFAKSVYMLTSESLQCENEMRAQIDCMVCNDNEDGHHAPNDALMPAQAVTSVESVCNFFENTYLTCYKQLLKDDHFGASLKNLLRNHLQQFNYSLNQLRLFSAVNTRSALN